MKPKKDPSDKVKRSIDFDLPVIQRLEEISAETRFSVPALINILSQAAIDYRDTNGVFATPIRVVSEMDYQRFLELQHLTSPETYRAILEAGGYEPKKRKQA